MDAEALKFALERLSQVLPELPVRLQTLLREEESLKTAIDAFLSDLETKQAEAGDLLSRLELSLQELRQESREGMTLLEGTGTWRSSSWTPRCRSRIGSPTPRPRWAGDNSGSPPVE